MKKVIVTIAVLTTALGAHAACEMSYEGDIPKINRALEKIGGFDFPGYEVFCSKLKNANARLSIASENGVLGGKSIAWSVVQVRDFKLPILSKVVSQSTQMNDFGDNGKSLELLGTAINTSLNHLDIDKAIESLNETRKSITMQP
jgi:hypothetical protein